MSKSNEERKITLQFTTDNVNDISTSLRMWANYIETRDVVLSTIDAQKMGKYRVALNTEQMKRVIELRELADRIYQTIYGSKN